MWNPQKYGGQAAFYTSAAKVWKPDIAFRRRLTNRFLKK